MGTAVGDESTAGDAGAPAAGGGAPQDRPTPLDRLALLPGEGREAVWAVVEKWLPVAEAEGQRCSWEFSQGRGYSRRRSQHPLEDEFQAAVGNALVTLVLDRSRSEGGTSGIKTGLVRKAARRECLDVLRADRVRRVFRIDKRGRARGGLQPGAGGAADRVRLLCGAVPDPRTLPDRTIHGSVRHRVDEAIRLLDRLPAKQRAAVRGHLIEGKSHPDLAAEQGLKKSTVAGRYERGVARLQELMGVDARDAA